MTARHYREGVVTCAKCGTPHTHVNCHEDGTIVAADDRPDLVLDILAAYSAVNGHASGLTMKDVISPRPPALPGHKPWIVDRRTRAGRAWTERVLLVSYIELDLCDRGLMRVIDEPCGPGGQFPWGLAITDEGRAYLAGHRTGSTDD
jgi:hypothetical protein